MEDADLIERLNRVCVNAGDMEAVLDRIQPGHRHSFEAGVDVIANVLPTQSNDYRLAMAFRLHALLLVLKNLLPIPAKPGIEQMVRVTSSAIRAACRCKLKSVDDQPAAFDLAEFKAAMDAAPSGGLV